MGEFMKEHPNLAKNLLPNCAQGKATVIRFWEDLARKLNAVGPPVKDAKMWRKVFAVQKYLAKKKLSFNNLSKRQTGGGGYVEKHISKAEEDIIEASGLEVAVEGFSSVKSFATNNTSRLIDDTEFEKMVEKVMNSSESSDDEIVTQSAHKQMKRTAVDTKLVSLGQNLEVSTEAKTIADDAILTPVPLKKMKATAVDAKLVLLEKNLQVATEAKIYMESKLDQLLKIQKRIFEIKEKKYELYCG